MRAVRARLSNGNGNVAGAGLLASISSDIHLFPLRRVASPLPISVCIPHLISRNAFVRSRYRDALQTLAATGNYSFWILGRFSLEMLVGVCLFYSPCLWEENF